VNYLLKRTLGRTGLQVSAIGFGGTWICEIGMDDAVKVVRRAFDLGVTYFDTARWDGDSEEKMGAALEPVRDKCVISTKTGSRTKKESLEDLQNSLAKLRTDKVDLIQLHGIDDEATLEKAMSPDGALATCKEARSKGLVDFVGISSHKPDILIKAIKTDEFDTVLVPINVITRQALEKLVPFAKDRNIGVVVMKPLSAKTSKLITCLYQPSLSLLSDEPELHELLGKDKAEMAQSALRFLLAQDISVTIPGMRSVEEVEANVKAGNEFKGLTSSEKKRFESKLAKDYCRDCGLCQPCAQKVDVASILRFHALYESYGLKNWARKLYSGLEVRADACNKCGECEPKCAYGLPVVEKLKKAHSDLKS
jgi:hypothetical protein